MKLTWLWRMEDALLHVLGPAQLNTARDVERHQRQQANQPPPTPALRDQDLLPGGWVRRGTPDHYYIVRSGDPARR